VFEGEGGREREREEGGKRERGGGGGGKGEVFQQLREGKECKRANIKSSNICLPYTFFKKIK
jgi:hypothetical protein